MKRIFWSFVVLFGLLASTLPAWALTRTLTWQAPTTNTDGTPAVVATYAMYRSSDGGVTFVKQLPLIPGTTLTYTDPNVPTGEFCYEVTASNANGESARSNRVCFSVPAAVPNAPTALSVSGTVGTVTAPSKRK